MRKTILKSYWAPLIATLVNLLLAYVVYAIARVAYLLDNWEYFSNSFTIEIIRGGFVFDTAAIFVTNIPYVILMLLPLHWKETRYWHYLCQYVFVFINGFALIVNLMDAAYFPYTLRRTTVTIFNEFQHEQNLGSVLFTEILHHWYFILLAIIVIYGLWHLYVMPRPKGHLSWWRYNLIMLFSLVAITPFIVAGIRGGFTTAVRPITISNANQYANRPIDAALVLNTPFALYRTVGKDVFVIPEYFNNKQEMATIFSPIHIPTDSVPMTKKNVVVLIVESFGREYIGALNWNLDNGNYKGYTPCVDSLIHHSVTFEYSFCNGRKSIDGMPSILSSIPMFVEPFVLTPASMNQVSGIADLLGQKGYQTAFFHGAQRNSMGFMAFARKTGFQNYYGREDYNTDPRFDGDDDYDGIWAIWDEPFLQYYCMKMSEMKQPFMTAVFTASSHHPYAIPEKYKDVYTEEGIIMHKCIRYTDMAIGKFFDVASQQPWFQNTIFVITSDHTNMSDHDVYQTDIGGFYSPIIIYEPGCNCQPVIMPKIAQQIDILPTIMGLLHYPDPYFAFGIDLFRTPADSTWAVNYLNGVYQYVKYGHVLQFDGQNTRAIYSLQDSLMQYNLTGRVPQQSQMECELKAIIQQYMERMVQDSLYP